MTGRDYNSPSLPVTSPRAPRRWVFLCLLLGIGAFFGLKDNSNTEEAQNLPGDSLHEPATDAGLILPHEETAKSDRTEISGRIRPGENFSESLAREGVSRQQIFELVPALRQGIHRAEFNPNIVQTGDTYTIVTDTSGTILTFEYSKRGDRERRFLAERTHGVLKARKETIPLRRDVTVVSSRIHDAIWSALSTSGENPDILAGKLEYIFEYYIDFRVDCRTGDRFNFAVEKFYAPDGNFVRYGDIVAAEYKSNKETETYQAFLYTHPNGKKGYYDTEGRSLQGIFLKAPLNFTRMSSGFSSRRFHPVLKIVTPHHGVDYAAPQGTPVWAIADGLVSYVGYRGALGNYVEIKHKNGYKTGYGHLSKFARGLQVGQRIAQKQTIGYVGATGRATGPHLHFNFYATINGNYKLINPDRAINRPTGQPVPKAQLAHFRKERDQLIALLEGNGDPAIAASISTGASSDTAAE